MFGALKPGFRSLAILKLVMKCRRRTLTRKEQLRHRAVSLRQHGTAFLLIAAGCFHLQFTLILYFDLSVFQWRSEWGAGVRTAPGDTLRGVTPELVFSVKNRNFLNWKTEVLMRTTNISKNDNLLKTRTVQI